MKSKIIWMIVGLFVIHIAVGTKTTFDEKKLYEITHKAITELNANNKKEASEILIKGDKIYRRNNFLRKITLNRKNGYSYINTSNSIKGRIALLNNQLELAKSHLIKSGQIKSSPTLGSFGPNMSLAKDLLQLGESKIVIEYLELCKLFWEHDSGQIEKWKEQISNNQIPNFGGNLIY